jgi:hypothetical protein
MAYQRAALPWLKSRRFQENAWRTFVFLLLVGLGMLFVFHWFG